MIHLRGRKRKAERIGKKNKVEIMKNVMRQVCSEGGDVVSSLEGRGVAQPVVLPVAVSTRANSLALRRTPKKRGMKEKTKSHVVARTHDTIQPNLSAQSKRRPQKRSSSRPQEESTQGRRAWARARACSEGLSNFTHCTAGGF